MQGEQVNHAIAGITLSNYVMHQDDRGTLGVLESGSGVSFAIKRVFYIKPTSTATVRAEHAVSATQALVALSGSVTVDVDNGSEQQTIMLHPDQSVLTIMPGVWLRLRDCAPDSIVLVISSLAYAETAYSSVPYFHEIDNG